MLEETSRYLIPGPTRFKCPPLVSLPWGLADLPRLLTGSAGSQELLEDKIREQYGVKHVILTDTSRSAFALYVMASGLDGELLIQSPMSYPLAVLFSKLGLQLAFTAVNEDFCVSLPQLEELVSSQTRAVLVTHMFGKTAPIDEIDRWARNRSVRVLSSMVQMPGGVKLHGRPLAGYGDAAFLSFSFDKPLHGIWGGALLTNDTDIFEKAKAIRRKVPSSARIAKLIAHSLISYRFRSQMHFFRALLLRGRGKGQPDDRYWRTLLTFWPDDFQNYQPGAIHSLQAAFAEKLMDRSPSWVKRKSELAEAAEPLLSGIKGVRIPANDDYPNTYQYYPIMLGESISRYSLGCELARKGIESKWRYYPLHLLPEFRDCRSGNMGETEKLWSKHLIIPINNGTLADAKHIALVIREFCGEDR